MTGRTYVCKRARLCSFLQERGFQPYKIAPDRSNPRYDVFLFTATPALYEAVLAFVQNNNKLNGKGTNRNDRHAEKRTEGI